MAQTLKIAIAGLAVLSWQLPAAPQSAPENYAKILELESELAALRAANAKLLARLDSVSGEVEDQEEFDDLALLTPPAGNTAQDGLSSFVDERAQSTGVYVGPVIFDLESAFRDSEIVSFNADGTLSPATRQSTASFSLTGNKDSGRAAVSLSESNFRSFTAGPTSVDCSWTGQFPPNDPCGTDQRSYVQSINTISFSSPLAKSGDTSFASLDGLLTGTKAEFRHTRYYGDLPVSKDPPSDISLLAALAKCVEEQEKLEKPDETACTTKNSAFYRRYMTRPLAEEYIHNNVIANSRGLTFSASLGYDEYEYFPDIQSDKDETERISGSVGAGYIYYPSAGSSLLFEGQYQRTFKAADTETRCRQFPDPNDTFLTCATGSFDKPSDEEKLIFSPQYRMQIAVSESGLIRNVALAPRFEYDVLSDDFALDVPIYLVASKKDGLVAGVRVGFQKEDDDGDLKFGVFYGKAFNLTPF